MGLVAREDGLNLIVFREQHWCHNERCGGIETYSGATVGMTTTYPAGSFGLDVKEADIELNAVRFEFATDSSKGAPEQARATPKPSVSLQATLVHEIGHVLGLRDACLAHTLSGAPDDNCPYLAKNSVMHAPAHLEQLSDVDRVELCALHGAPPTNPSSQTTEDVGAWWHATTLIAFGTLIAVALGVRHLSR
ncbi:MAG TPA: hypothetical protein VHM70_28350 [Polyangiaceae bacterium]|jgi:hypothetical protein|nr:hypothetical protein [Polyangiaceae bacterium]